MARIDFPDGNWLELREAAEVPERLRRPYLAASVAAATAPDDSARTTAVRRASAVGAVAVISDWSWSTPVSVDALEDMPSLAYDLILDATEKTRDALTWSLVVAPTPEARQDPKAPIDDSPPSPPGWVILPPTTTAATSESTPATGVTTAS